MSEATVQLAGSQALDLLQQISTWGNTTTIILHGGSVFEFKGDFPTGTMAEGFYNLKGNGGFEGHLNLESVQSIQFQSKNHRGRESHALVFVDKNNDTIFKIFLGRDAEGNLLQHQLEKFEQLRQQAVSH
ncbi:MAG: heme utilization cystosolic carrier protein HutX [Pseudomonadales bacterium]